MSLRTRLILSYSLIIIVCLGIIAIVVSLLVQGYRDRLTMTYLNELVQPIYIQVRTLVTADTQVNNIFSGLKEQADESDIYILLVDSGGKVVWQASPGMQTSNRIKLPADLLTANVRNQQGKFETESSTSYIYAAQPVASLTAASARLAFNYVVLAVPRGQPIAILISMAGPFFYAGLAAFAVSIIIAVVLGRSLYQPVRRVTMAAEQVALGHYDQEISVSGPKEVQQLAVGFNRMTAEVRIAQDRLRHFVADVSHQLKSPLTSIQGFAQAIIDGTAEDEESRTRAAGIIQEESKKMMRQVDELLDLSRMQSGQTAMQMEPVNLEELLKECRDIYSLRLEEKKLHLVMDIPLLPVISGDADRLEQVFSNLLDNAIKNSLPGQEIRITARKTKSTVEISIADTGAGIPPEQILYVFQRFYQAIGVRTGVGLGLAIAWEIIHGHGGDIRVTSNPGEKTEFIVELPITPRGKARA